MATAGLDLNSILNSAFGMLGSTNAAGINADALIQTNYLDNYVKSLLGNQQYSLGQGQLANNSQQISNDYNLGMSGQQNAYNIAQMQSDAQKYGYDQGLAGTKYAADAGVQQADITGNYGLQGVQTTQAGETDRNQQNVLASLLLGQLNSQTQLGTADISGNYGLQTQLAANQPAMQSLQYKQDIMNQLLPFLTTGFGSAMSALTGQPFSPTGVSGGVSDAQAALNAQAGEAQRQQRQQEMDQQYAAENQKKIDSIVSKNAGDKLQSWLKDNPNASQDQKIGMSQQFRQEAQSDYDQQFKTPVAAGANAAGRAAANYLSGNEDPTREGFLSAIKNASNGAKQSALGLYNSPYGGTVINPNNPMSAEYQAEMQRTLDGARQDNSSLNQAGKEKSIFLPTTPSGTSTGTNPFAQFQNMQPVGAPPVAPWLQQATGSTPTAGSAPTTTPTTFSAASYNYTPTGYNASQGGGGGGSSSGTGVNPAQVLSTTPVDLPTASTLSPQQIDRMVTSREAQDHARLAGVSNQALENSGVQAYNPHRKNALARQLAAQQIASDLDTETNYRPALLQQNTQAQLANANLTLAQQKMIQDAQLGNAQLGLAGQQLDATKAYQQGQLGLTGQQISAQSAYNQGQLGLGQAQLQSQQQLAEQQMQQQDAQFAQQQQLNQYLAQLQAYNAQQQNAYNMAQLALGGTNSLMNAITGLFGSFAGAI